MRLIVSLETANEAVALATVAGYVVTLPVSNTVERPLRKGKNKKSNKKQTEKDRTVECFRLFPWKLIHTTTDLG